LGPEGVLWRRRFTLEKAEQHIRLKRAVAQRNTRGVITSIHSYGEAESLCRAKFKAGKGDGVSDDTNPIRTAIAAAQAAGGGIVWFANGTYAISEHCMSERCIDLPGGVSLLGQSRDGVVLFMAECLERRVPAN
jgi:Pectate lyase superfamily protein